MNKHILYIVAFALMHMPSFGQDTNEEENGVTFLPHYKGEVVNKISGIPSSNAVKVFSVISSWQPFISPQGFKLTAHGDNTQLEVMVEPYFSQDGITLTNGGASLNVYFNDPLKIFRSSVVADIYIKPLKVAEFYGYPIYYNGYFETTIIGKSHKPLFVPVTREEYLKALIAEEEKKQKGYGQTMTADEYQKEIDKTYRELLKTDKQAAAEFKKEMEGVVKEYAASNKTPDVISLLKEELQNLSAQERQQQAYYALGAMEKYGNFSGLVPESDKGQGEPLVRPNYNLIEKGKGSIQLMVMRWNIKTEVIENESSPRRYTPKQNIGYELSDNKIAELYNSPTIWARIFSLVK